MVAPTTWTELHRCDDADRARTLLVCLEAMEFDARLVEVPGGQTSAAFRQRSSAWRIDVPESHWETLREIVDEILAEQDEFDEFMAAWEQRTGRTQRKVLVVLVVIVGSLAAVGAIRL